MFRLVVNRQVYVLWRRLPRGLRRRLFDSIFELLSKRLQRGTVLAGPFVACGLIKSTSSQGWSVRATYALLHRAGCEVLAYDLSDLQMANDFAPDIPLINGSMINSDVPRGGGTVILHCSPRNYRYFWTLLPPSLRRGKHVVGYSAWELPAIPEDWSSHLDVIDEAWVPSRFVAEAFRVCRPDLPTRVVPHFLEAPTSLNRSRSDFGLPPQGFLVAAFCNLRSGTTRKNLLGCIQAFRCAFQGCQDAWLVLKLSDCGLEPARAAAICAAIEGLDNVILVDLHYDDQQIWEFLACVDVVLSPHRAEGFGLVLAQAMMLGKPVIATGYSGNLDFMNDENSILLDYELLPVTDPEGVYTQRDQRWAEPSIPQAAEALRRLYEQPALRTQIGCRARRDMTAFYQDSTNKAAELGRARQAS